MKIRVNPHNVEIVKEQTEPINELEIKVSKCEFEFDEVVTDDFVKEAYFTLNGSTYKQIIENNECDYPSEVLTEKGTLEIGVVAFKVENGEEIVRYNPSPDYFESWVGSLKDAENSEPITPSEMEQFEQELQNGLNDIEEAIENAERLNIEASKSGKITTITITKQDGTTESEDILDGEKGDKGDKGDIGPAPVRGVDYWTSSDVESIESDLESDVTTEVTSQLGSLVSATPLGASSMSDMTDTTRIYVNTTDGHWYWYDGDSWEDGGVYQATGIDENDPIIEKINDNFKKYKQTIYPNDLFIQGAINGGGEFISSNTAFVWKDWQPVVSGKSYVCTFREDLGYRVAVNMRDNPDVVRNNIDIVSGKPFIVCYDDERKIKVRLTKLNDSGVRQEMTQADVSLSEFKFEEYDNSLFYAKATSNAKSWNYIETLKKGSKIVCIVNGGRNVAVRLGTGNIYNATDAKIIFDNAFGDPLISNIITLDKDYKSVRVFSDTQADVRIYSVGEYESLTLTSLDQRTTLLEEKIGKNAELLPITFEQYAFNGGGGGGTTINNKVARTQYFYDDGLYLITFPDELKATYNAKNYESNPPRINITSYHPFSMFCDEFVRVYFERKNGEDLLITDEILKQVKIYRVSSIKSDYDITVAANDSNDYHKNKADIVLNGTNDTRILSALFGCFDSIDVMLYPGNYNINEMYTFSNTTKIALPFNEYNIEGGMGFRRYIKVSGSKKCTPQTKNCVNLVVDEQLHNSLENNKTYFVIGTAYNLDNNEIQRMAVSCELSNFNIIGHKYDKPITYVDTTRCLSTAIESVNVRSWKENINLYNAFNETPNLECCGIRVGRGSDYGIQNYVKHSNVWYCGKGLAINGEHFIIEDVKVHHDYIGWVVGDRKTVGRVEHPNILIGCSTEGCYRIAQLSKMGITQEQDFVYNYENKMQYSTLIIVGMSTETTWTIPVNERIEGQPTAIDSKPILEILRGCYRGRIEIDLDPSHLFASGSGVNMKYICYAGANTYTN